MAFFAVLVFICLRKWLGEKFCSRDDGYEYVRHESNSGDQLSLTDRERRRRRFNSSGGSPVLNDGKHNDLVRDQKVSFLSESGRPLLFSFDESAYDDAAYLVDRTFDRPYQFTGSIH